MSREKGSFLDAFYNTPSNHKDKNEVKQKTKVVTYSLKEDNVKYVELQRRQREICRIACNSLRIKVRFSQSPY